MYKTQRQLENHDDGEYENELIDDKEFNNYEYRKDKKNFKDSDDEKEDVKKEGKGRTRTQVNKHLILKYDFLKNIN